MKFNPNPKAQGTIEYLVILAIIVVVAIVVVALLAQNTSSGAGVADTTNKIQTQTRSLALAETIVNSDGNYFLKLDNKTGNNITITNIKIGDAEYTPQQYIPSSTNQAFKITTPDTCTTGEKTYADITITYTTSAGLEKIEQYKEFQLDCLDYGTVKNVIEGEGVVPDTTAPLIALETPTEQTTANSTVDFQFNVTDDSSVDCDLIVGGSTVDSLTQITTSTTQTITYTLPDATQTTWTISCTDSASNTANAIETRDIQYTPPWTPSSISTIAWYDGNDSSTITTSGSNVTNWADKSGNGYDLDTAPKTPGWGDWNINDLNIVYFDGTFDRIYRENIPSINVSEVTILSVGEWIGGNWNELLTIRSSDSSDYLYSRRSSGNDSVRSNIGLDGSGSNMFFADDSDYATGVPFLTSSYYDGDFHYLRGNGGSSSVSADVSDGVTFTINTIGAGRLWGNSMNHYIGEMLVIETSDISTIEKAEGYLAWKWGLEGKLPAGHTYKNAAPLVE